MNIQVHWKMLLLHLILWLTGEMILSLAGLDDRSNYSEFVWQQHTPELRRV